MGSSRHCIDSKGVAIGLLGVLVLLLVVVVCLLLLLLLLLLLFLIYRRCLDGRDETLFREPRIWNRSSECFLVVVVVVVVAAAAAAVL